MGRRFDPQPVEQGVGPFFQKMAHKAPSSNFRAAKAARKEPEKPVFREKRSAPGHAQTVMMRLLNVYLLVSVFRFASALIYASFHIVATRPA